MSVRQCLRGEKVAGGQDVHISLQSLIEKQALKSGLPCDVQEFMQKLSQHRIKRTRDLALLSKGSVEQRLSSDDAFSLGEISTVLSIMETLICDKHTRRRSARSRSSRQESQCKERRERSPRRTEQSSGSKEHAKTHSIQKAGQADPLWQAVCDGDEKLCRDILSGRADPDTQHQGWTPLMKAAETGQYIIADLLLDYNASTSAVNAKGRGALSLAAAPPNTSDGQRRPAQLDIINLLLDRGADLNAKDQRGQTAIDRAKKEERTDAVELLAEWAARFQAKLILKTLHCQKRRTRRRCGVA
eukprot:TRINITY_DN73947_c0_g1_i1.p1 TRINITY_DN73947_c0_g1~~TRINITY_DN73947_c0_g1_i1.p1  ORF type:complete len:301 (+),score=45.41 TRINITY_DN73947_c0_g1_i1:33-935(+)